METKNNKRGFRILVAIVGSIFISGGVYMIVAEFTTVSFIPVTISLIFLPFTFMALLLTHRETNQNHTCKPTKPKS